MDSSIKLALKEFAIFLGFIAVAAISGIIIGGKNIVVCVEYFLGILIIGYTFYWLIRAIFLMFGRKPAKIVAKKKRSS